MAWTAKDLSKWRDDLHLTRDDAAKILELSYSHYCKLESENDPQPVSLRVECTAKYYVLAKAYRLIRDYS